MVALLLPVMPFAASYALYSPHPELLAMAALVAFAFALTRYRTQRARLALSTAYGIDIAILAFMHEAIPLALGLGGALAVAVLAGDAAPRARRIYTSLAVLPGLFSIAVIAIFGRRDVASQLCTELPHRGMENPYAASETPQKAIEYVLGHLESRTDFHDWDCSYIGILDTGPVDGMRSVANFGFVPLLNSFIGGFILFVLTLWAIGYLSGVSVRTLYIEFRLKFRLKLTLPALALCLTFPLFITGVDWTRWWILITADVAAVYILYVIRRPEAYRPPSGRTVAVFVGLVLVLSVIPTGAALHIGGPNF
jgi:hypothetical protein